MLSRLHRFLIPATVTPPRQQIGFWLSLSLTFALLYAFLGLRPAFGDYVVQDDARQHVFWMRRFLDPELFPNDLIADYFQSTAPKVYAGLYRAAAALGIDPLLLNKLLPIALAVITTLYCFGVCLQLLPIPFAGFVASLLLNQNLWLQDDLVSGIARAFVFPIFLAFLYYLLRRALAPCLIAIALQGLIYPQLVFIMAGVLVLRLIRWENGSLQVTRNRRDYVMSGLGLLIAFAVLLPYALETSPYAPVVTATQARTMPEFGEQGRTRLFVSNPWAFWLTEERTGLLVWVMPLCILSIALLPIFLRFPNRFPLVKRVRHISLLMQVAIVSLFWFLAAHALLFTLYLPSRYSQNTFQMLTALTGAIAVTVGIDRLLRWAAAPVKQGASQRQMGAIAAVAALAAVLLFSPYLWEFPRRDRVFAVGEYPALYEFFAAQPKDILIASLAREADNLPTFAQRSILTSREYSIPYHTGYYGKLYERTEDLIRAQYSPDLSVVQDFVRRYDVDFWLIDRAFLRQPDPPNGDSRIKLWLQQFQPVVTEVTERLEQGEVPIVRRRLNRCTVAEEKDLVVLSAACLTQGR